MVRPHERRTCTFIVEPTTGRMCGIELHGRGRYVRCAKHSVEMRDLQRKLYGAAYVREWRLRNREVEQIRRFIQREVDRMVNFG